MRLRYSASTLLRTISRASSRAALSSSFKKMSYMERLGETGNDGAEAGYCWASDAVDDIAGSASVDEGFAGTPNRVLKNGHEDPFFSTLLGWQGEQEMLSNSAAYQL